MAHRMEVIGLYRSIMKMARRWEGGPAEKRYIRNEARNLFQKNKDLSDESQISAKIFEGRSRMELAEHYRIPYPKFFNAPPGVSPNQMLKDPEHNVIQPSYLNSYDLVSKK
eukprot:TRINITY_DN3451_c0_g1_i1.p1 TRINITY_DN3451_c0_g1~~TRINITY_DN3451_c0_g1_i1.p1  ORF type:complete len:124 (-),score=27.69 TRINITY_DN3451_c0_g1_i1:385-717(-)